MKALELADRLEGVFPLTSDLTQAAAELRRIAEVNAELLGALEECARQYENWRASEGYSGNSPSLLNAKSAIAKAKEQQ